MAMHIKALATGGAAFVKPGSLPEASPVSLGKTSPPLPSSSSSLLSRSMAERWAAVFRIRDDVATGPGMPGSSSARTMTGQASTIAAQPAGSPEPAPCKACRALPWRLTAPVGGAPACRALVHGESAGGHPGAAQLVTEIGHHVQAKRPRCWRYVAKRHVGAAGSSAESLGATGIRKAHQAAQSWRWA